MKRIVIIFLLAAVTAAAAAAAASGRETPEAAIRIDASDAVAEINPWIYGHFIEFLGKCIEGRLWITQEEAEKFGHKLVLGGVREDIFEAIKGLDIPLLRFPGGCYSDVYHWRDGVGPRDQRPELENLHWGGIVKNGFGTDEFLQLCESLEIEPLINVNLGAGTAEEAADWVRYVNDPPDTEWGRMRAANGHPAPYGVKMWGIGNESFGDWEKGNLDNPSLYVDKYLEFYKEMKAADPAIKMLAVGATQVFRPWNETVVPALKDFMDYYSLHLYFPTMEITGGIRNPKTLYHIIVGSTAEFNYWVDLFIKDLKRLAGPDSNIKAALDEWNLVWYKENSINYSDFEISYGLFTADMLMSIQKRSPDLAFANFALLVEVIPIIVANDESVLYAPQYYAFQLVRRHSGDRLLRAEVDCPVFSNLTYGTVMARNDNPYITVSATTSADRSKLYLIVVNKHYSKSITTSIDVGGMDINSYADVWTLKGDSPRAKNTFTERNNVRVVQSSASFSGRPFVYTFPPHSVTALEFGAAASK